MAISGALSVQEVRAVLESLRSEMRPLLNTKTEVWQGQVVEVVGSAVRVARGDEPTTAGSLLRPAYPVVGAIPAVGAQVWVASWVGGGIVITGGGGGASLTTDYLDFEDTAMPPGGWTQHVTVDGSVSLTNTTSASLDAAGTRGMRVVDNSTTVDPNAFIDKAFPIATYGNQISLSFLWRVSAFTATNDRSVQIGGITTADVSQDDPVGLYIYRNASGVLDLYAYRWDNPAFLDTVIETGVTTSDVFDLQLKASGFKSKNGEVEVWCGKNGAPRTLRWAVAGLDFTADWFESMVPWLGPQDGFAVVSSTATMDYDRARVSYGGVEDTGVITKGQILKATDQTQTGSTLYASITGMDIPVTSGQLRRFRFGFLCTAPSATSAATFAITGPTLTQTGYTVRIPGTTNTSETLHTGTGYDHVLTPPTDFARTIQMVTIDGFVETSVAGVITPRIKLDAAGSTVVVKAGSFAEYW